MKVVIRVQVFARRSMRAECCLQQWDNPNQKLSKTVKH